MTLKFIKFSLSKKLLLSAFISICLLHASPVAALDVFDLFLIKSLKDFNEPLIKRMEQADFDNNILVASKVNEAVRSASAEELADVLRLANKLSAHKIQSLMNSEITRRATPSIISEFNYFEKVVLGTRPVEDTSCDEVGGKCYLNGLNPERFSLDLPDLKLSTTAKIISPEDRISRLPQKQRAEKHSLEKTFNEGLEFLWKHSPAKTLSINFRQKLWIREYEESEFYPAYANGKMFVQNANRMECLDAFSGEVKWTFYPGPHNGYDEKLIISSNLHDMQPSYHMAVENDAVYAELVNQFMKLDVSQDRPQVKWQISLGAYTLASKPYIVGDGIFIALINVRGELWGAMVDKESGRLLWNTFIALVTQVCPSSDLITHDDSTLYFVTNRGISVALNRTQGIVKWLSEYEFKQYLVSDIWKRDREFWRTEDVPYTTSWVGIDDDMIVMKPRDSDFVYFRDKVSGKVLVQFYLEDMTFLMSDGMTAYFLKDNTVSAVNIITGEQNRVGQAPGVNLRGVLYDPVTRECVIKLDQSLFLLQSHKGTARLSQLKSGLSPEGWLRGAQENGVYFDCSKDSIARYGVKDSHVARKDENVRAREETVRPSDVKKAVKRKRVASSKFMEDKSQDDFVLAEGEKIRSLAVLYDSPEFPFFLTLKRDVLVCAMKKDAQVVWTKRLIGYRLSTWSSPLHNLVLSAALYGKTIVVFDGINLFGADVESGEIRWNISARDEGVRELLSYQAKLTNRDRAYLFDTLFSPDSVVYFKKGSLCFIDPKTGDTLGVVDTGHRYITGLRHAGRYLMCGYLFEAKVALYDYKKMTLIKELDVQKAVPDLRGRGTDAAGTHYDLMKKFEPTEFSMAFVYPYCYLQVSSGLWSFDFKTEKVIRRAGEFATQKDWSIAIVGREILSFNPLWKVVIWDEGLKKVKKEVPLSLKPYDATFQDVWQPISDARQLWSLKESTFIHSAGSILVCPVKESDGFYIAGIDLQKGVPLWKVFATNSYPKLWHMSNSAMMGNIICLTLSVKDQGNDWAGDDAYVDTTFLAIDAKKGVALKQLRFPQGMSWGRYLHYLSSIGNNSVLVNENDERLRVLRIKG